MRSLRARITAITVIVAVVAVLVTGLISLQLVRSTALQEARTQVAAQAEILARLPGLATAADLSERASLALGGTEVALVSADGSVSGTAAGLVDARILRALDRGEAVSTSRGDAQGRAIVEARSARDRTSVVLALPLSSIDRALGQVMARIVVALGIGLAVAVLGGALLGRQLSRPLSQTAAAARRLAAGERGVTVPSPNTSELMDVATALTTLDTALTTSEARQREFLLSISHELRTPLTAVRGYAEAMADGLVDDVAATGRTLVAETERLDTFVADLLELARLEADDFSISAAPVDLQAVLAEVVEAWSGRASLLGATVSAAEGEASTASSPVATDAHRLRQVLDGLVENALRAGSSSVVLVLGATTVDVVDNGPGIDDADLAHAFDRGALRARYRDVRSVGTGLGLSIAARLVERLGGSIAVSNPPGGGAKFSVTLARGAAGTPKGR